MLSNHILQKTLDGITKIVKHGFAVYDMEGNHLASTFESKEDHLQAVKEFAKSQAQSQVAHQCQFTKIMDERVPVFILLSEGEEDTHGVNRLVAFQLQELMVAYRERFDRENFMKNLLMDNLLMVDVYNRSRKLGIELEQKRIAVIVEVTGERTGDEIGLLRERFPERNGDFVTAIDEDNVIVICHLEKDVSSADMEKKAQDIIHLFPEDKQSLIRVSYGNQVNELRAVSRSYKEASLALDVGKIFFKEKQIIGYSALGIGRLIYQLPIPLCNLFIHEIFQKKLPSDFDAETLMTINKFFENNLNVSETSRQLYIHRNTLVYRLDKIQKNTGLDLRVFEDAITFKIALMVVEYMKYMEA